MRTIIILLLLPFLSMAQAETSHNNTYGYVNGVRLDSVDARYAQVGITTGMRIVAGNAIRRFTFDFGQKWSNEKDVRVTDAAGNVLTFYTTSGALNFFDFNGWEFVLINYDPYQLLLKRKAK